jgi:hypothetical protein
MVVESLVTLMQAGCVSIESQTNQFGLTPSGVEACKQDQGLPPLLHTEDRWQIVVMERVAGQIARGDNVKPSTKKSLAKVWHLGAKIPKSDISNVVDPGMVRPLLSGRSGERIRWVGPITTASDNNAYVVVGVDTTSGRIIGIPASWEALLAPDLLERARRHERELALQSVGAEDMDLEQFVSEVVVGASREKTACDITLEEGDVAIGSQENRAMLERMITRSESFLAIASSTLTSEIVLDLLPLFQEAVAVGKSIFVSWGGIPEADRVAEHKNAVKVLEKLQWDSRHGTSGRFVVAASEGHFSANIVIGDVDGWIESTVGTYPWLGQRSSRQGISVQLRHPGLVARLCDVVGDYHSSDPRLKRAAGLTRLRNAALELSGIADSVEPSASSGTVATLVFDRQHSVELRQLISSARDRVSITCDEIANDLDTNTLSFLQAVLHRDLEVQVYLRAQEASAGLAALRKRVTDADPLRISVEGPVEAPGSCVLADSSVILISNYPSLGPLRSSQRPLGSDVGLKLSGTELAGLIERLSPPLAN